MVHYTYTGTAEDFTVWLYPRSQSMVRHYRSGKAVSIETLYYYMRYRTGSIVKVVPRARSEAFVNQFLSELGHPSESLRWRATECKSFQRSPWNIAVGRTGIYFVAAEGTDLVKIGYAIDVSSRINAISAGCPYPMRVLAVIPGEIPDEHKLHRRFRMYHVHNEWFRIDGDLRSYLDTLPAPSQ